MTEDHDDDAMLSDARLDALLDASPERAPSADLMRRVAQIPIEHGRADGVLTLWPFASLGRMLASAGLALSLGAASGLVVVTDEMLEDDLVELSALSTDDGWDLEDMR